jgi:hypothetical protein
MPTTSQRTSPNSPQLFSPTTSPWSRAAALSVPGKEIDEIVSGFRPDWSIRLLENSVRERLGRHHVIFPRLSVTEGV